MPTQMKVVRGIRADRINNAEPILSKKTPRPPDNLCAEAIAVWDEIAPQLLDAGVLFAVDSTALGVYCEAVAQYWEASRIVQRDGLLVPGERGLVKNPAMQYVRECGQTILAYSREFGLTPSARSQLKVERDEPKAGAERLLS